MTDAFETSDGTTDDWRGWSPVCVGFGGDVAPLAGADIRTPALVLEARDIPFRTRKVDGGWLLMVPARYACRAGKELQTYERENADWPPSPPPAVSPLDNTLPTLCILLLLATFHNLTLLDATVTAGIPIDWTNLGSAYAGKIRNGEWWRVITALTLHADALHLLGNLAIGGVFVLRLCRQLGGGFAWSLILASGIFGNLANAFLQPYHHQAVGASTAVFGAVGILAGWTFLRYRRTLWRRWAIPLAGALGLLALLGTGGENTDLGAHLLGFVFGLPLGLMAAGQFRVRGRPRPARQALLSLLAAGAVLAAWTAAIAAATPTVF